MKKMMCVLILVAFIGSMVVMTGCFGGSSGIGAILAGALIISLVATGPASAAAFAASERGPRAEIRAATSVKYVARITPTGRTPVEVTSLEVVGRTIAFSDIQVEAGTNGQVLVEIFPAGYDSTTDPIFKYYAKKVVANGGAETVNYNINASDTAKALLYDSWTSSSTFTIDNFAPTTAQVNNVAAKIIERMDGNGSTYSSTFVWDTDTIDVSGIVTANTPDAISLPAVTGYVYRKDGTAMDNHMVWLKQGDTEVRHVITNEDGYFIIQSITPGSYVLSPEELEGHTFSPANYSLTFAQNTAFTNQDFRAQ